MSEELRIKNINRQGAPQDELDIISTIGIIWQHKFYIAAITLLTAIVTLSVSLVLPKKYVSEATLLPTSSNDPGAVFAAGLASQLGAVSSLGGIGMLGSDKGVELVEILSSRSMAKRVIAEQQLDQRLSGWSNKNQLISALQKITTITPPSLKNKVIRIRVEAPEPELAADIANGYVSELKGMLDEIGYNQATKNRRFLESQLSSSKLALTKAEENLAQFQTKNRLASLPETIMSSIKSISELEAQQVNTEVQISTAKETQEVLRSKINSLQAEPGRLIDIDIQRKSLAAQKSSLEKARNEFLNKLESLPPKGMELARLQRDVQVRNAIYLALSQQYESAMITESKDSDSFLPLDTADVPYRPSSPRLLVNTAVGLLSGFMLGVLAALLKGRVRILRRP